MGHDDVSVTVVTPERRALSLFGDEASAAVADELARRGRRAQDRRRGAPRQGRSRPRARRRARRGSARLRRAAARWGRRSRACRPTRRGSSSRVTTRGSRAASAPGPRGTRSSPPSSSAASQRIRRVAPRQRSRAWPAPRTLPTPASPCSTAGCCRPPHAPPERPRRRRGRAAVVAARQGGGEYLPRWLTEHGVTPPAAEEPADEGLTVHRPLSEMRGPELRVPRRPGTRIPQRRSRHRRTRSPHARGSRALGPPAPTAARPISRPGSAEAPPEVPAMSSVESTPTGRPVRGSTTTAWLVPCSSMRCATSGRGSSGWASRTSPVATSPAVRSATSAAQRRMSWSVITAHGWRSISRSGSVASGSTTIACTCSLAIRCATASSGVPGSQVSTRGRIASATRACSKLG